ncbi:unnamed protein product [Ceratitis capitata]|uniref:(Mediterranean fruit fly) hypothetical protein n=1 Tax=Ceratitis capitata TaxID=7213 RepID=A0A811V981_CERCA|nr:unnamed protein product [Ceratitis capitata]
MQKYPKIHRTQAHTHTHIYTHAFKLLQLIFTHIKSNLNRHSGAKKVVICKRLRQIPSATATNEATKSSEICIAAKRVLAAFALLRTFLVLFFIFFLVALLNVSINKMGRTFASTLRMFGLFIATTNFFFFFCNLFYFFLHVFMCSNSKIIRSSASASSKQTTSTAYMHIHMYVYMYMYVSLGIAYARTPSNESSRTPHREAVDPDLGKSVQNAKMSRCCIASTIMRMHIHTHIHTYIHAYMHAYVFTAFICSFAFIFGYKFSHLHHREIHLCRANWDDRRQ